MTYLEALYGSQYAELRMNGQTTDNGRVNGNMFLTALIIMCMLCGFGLLMLIFGFLHIPANEVLKKLGNSLHISGKMMGIYVVLPLLLIIYFVVNKYIGNEENYKQYYTAYMQYPDEMRNNANKKTLRPLFTLIILFFVIIMLSTLVK